MTDEQKRRDHSGALGLHPLPREAAAPNCGQTVTLACLGTLPACATDRDRDCSASIRKSSSCAFTASSKSRDRSHRQRPLFLSRADSIDKRQRSLLVSPSSRHLRLPPRDAFAIREMETNTIGAGGIA